MKLVLATRNRDKISEIRLALKGLRVELVSLEEFPDAPEVVEDGLTLEDNALKKAQSAADATGLMAIADDTGLEVAALDGRPGVFSARFAGEEASYNDNCKKLLRDMESIPTARRVATFRTVIALIDPSEGEEIFEGRCDGKITMEPRGQNGFGYDPIFEVASLKKTFAELSAADKDRVSHRGRALRHLRQRLLNLG